MGPAARVNVKFSTIFWKEKNAKIACTFYFSDDTATNIGTYYIYRAHNWLHSYKLEVFLIYEYDRPPAA